MFKLVSQIFISQFVFSNIINLKQLFFFALLAIALALPKPGPGPNPQFYAVGAAPVYSTYAAYPYAYGWGGLVY
jgi:hypothetical protein